MESGGVLTSPFSFCDCLESGEGVYNVCIVWRLLILITWFEHAHTKNGSFNAFLLCYNVTWRGSEFNKYKHLDKWQ